ENPRPAHHRSSVVGRLHWLQTGPAHVAGRHPGLRAGHYPGLQAHGPGPRPAQAVLCQQQPVPAVHCLCGHLLSHHPARQQAGAAAPQIHPVHADRVVRQHGGSPGGRVYVGLRRKRVPVAGVCRRRQTAQRHHRPDVPLPGGGAHCPGGHHQSFQPGADGQRPAALPPKRHPASNERM
ncbi:MAG: hypothetical protein AVDCRST_MAG56-2652, partial [uncultured Cytophagales bacterium]